ncbi:MAG: hypothetical protein Q7S57_01145 [bacterium]|nr:hypothetical protein [bacterium]
MQKKKTKNILHPVPCPLYPYATKTLRRLAFLFSIVFLFFSLATPALADPHAMFYTDKGQQQVFYNFLAALNQADYVEAPNSPDPYTPPSPPSTSYNPSNPARIYSDEIVGNYIATRGGLPTPGPSAQPETQERSNLPRIMVRQVTSDNGDAFYRQQLAQRAYAEEVRSILSFLVCRNNELIYGPSNSDGSSLCPNETGNASR